MASATPPAKPPPEDEGAASSGGSHAGKTRGYCDEDDQSWEPLNMDGQKRTEEEANGACQARCLSVSRCYHWTFWTDGGCHLQDISAQPKYDAGASSGPPVCGPDTILHRRVKKS